MTTDAREDTVDLLDVVRALQEAGDALAAELSGWVCASCKERFCKSGRQALARWTALRAPKEVGGG